MRESQAQAEIEKKALTEQFESAKRDYTIKVKRLTENLSKAQEKVEHYKRVAQEVVDKYIESQSLALGIPSKDLKKRLGEGFTISDVDKVCEDLREQYYHLSKLPFNVGRQKVEAVVTTPVPQVGKQDAGVDSDDCVDDDLLRLAKLK